MRCLFVFSILLSITCGFASEEISVLGAAKPGDGSEIAKAFEAFRTAKLKGVEGGQDLHSIRLKASYVIQLPAGTLNGVGDQATSMDQSAHFHYFGYVNSEGFDWISIRVESPKETVEGLKEELDMIQEAVYPAEKLTPAQQTKIVQLLGAPRRKEIHDAWKRAQSNLKDKKLSTAATIAIVDGLKNHEVNEAARYNTLCEQLTPKQAKIFRKQFQTSETEARTASSIFAPRAPEKAQAPGQVKPNLSPLEQVQNRGKQELANLEIVGVAKVGDGSPIARAWTLMPGEIKAAEEKARKDWESGPFAAKGNRISGMAVASSGAYQAQKPDPIHWIVQLKAKAASNGGSVSNHRIPYEKELYSFMHQIGGGSSSTWVGVGKIQDSGVQRYDPLQWLRDNAEKIAKSAHPFNDKQKSDFESLQSYHSPDVVPAAWSKVEADMTDKEALRQFVETYFLHKDDSTLASLKFDSLLTPEQKRVLQGNGPSMSMSSSSGPDGGINVATVTANGKKTLTITLQNMLLPVAVKSIVENVNTEFDASVSTPKVDAALAKTRVNCKIVLDGADGAIQKLANAAGCKTDTSNVNTTLKAK